MAKVSIIIPTYNSEKYILETINSALCQEEVCTEVIVIDDGSNDQTKELLISSGVINKINYIYQHNQGVSAARNNGMRVASGEYCCFLDSDDSLHKDFCVKLITELNKRKIDIVYSNYYYYLDGNINNIIKKNFPKHSNYIFPELISGNFIPTDCVLFRKKILNKENLFDINFKTMEDWLFWLKLSENNLFGFVDEKLCAIRVRKESLTTNYIQLNNNIYQAYRIIENLYQNELLGLEARYKRKFYYNYVLSELRIGKIKMATFHFVNNYIYKDINKLIPFFVRLLYYVIFKVANNRMENRT